MQNLENYMMNSSSNDNMKYYIAGGVALVLLVVLIVVLANNKSKEGYSDRGSGYNEKCTQDSHCKYNDTICSCDGNLLCLAGLADATCVIDK